MGPEPSASAAAYHREQPPQDCDEVTADHDDWDPMVALVGFQPRTHEMPT